jgi:hypothetical protein
VVFQAVGGGAGVSWFRRSVLVHARVPLIWRVGVILFQVSCDRFGYVIGSPILVLIVTV